MALRVLHLIPYLGRAMGGPPLALAALAEGLREAGAQVTVATVERAGDGPRVALASTVPVTAERESHAGSFRWAPRLRASLSGRDFDVVHSHGLWTWLSVLADRIARERRIPHVLAPCGMLQEEALRRSAWKKRLCRVAFQDRILGRARCLHAKAAAEAEGFRRLGLGGPIAVLPNPVEPPPDPLPAGPEFARGLGLPGGTRLALYLGRLHPVKGLPRLLQAWAGLGERRPGWHLVLAGPDEAGHRSELQAQIDAAHLSGAVSFVGEVNGARKWAALGAASLFVMPSDFENFGTAIAEALLCGVPVVTTTGTPWSQLAETGCGWWVERSPASLAGALAEALALPSEELARRGAAGRRLAAAVDARSVAESCSQLYLWLLGRADPPACLLPSTGRPGAAEAARIV